MNPIFKSSEGERLVRERYQAFLHHWPVANEQLHIATTQGSTFVVVSGPKDAPPLLLLHGSAANSAMWMGDITILAGAFRVYCIDMIGEPGFSAPGRVASLGSGGKRALVVNFNYDPFFEHALFKAVKLKRARDLHPDLKSIEYEMKIDGSHARKLQSRIGSAFSVVKPHGSITWWMTNANEYIVMPMGQDDRFQLQDPEGHVFVARTAFYSPSRWIRPLIVRESTRTSASRAVRA